MKHPDTRSNNSAGPQSRRDFIVLGVGALAAGAIPLTLSRRRSVVRRQVPVMGTIADIVVLHRDNASGQAAVDAAIDELRFVDRTMTRFNQTSDVGRINGSGFGQPVVVHPATALVIAAGLEWAERSNGRFDPALGRVTSLWDREGAAIPPTDEVLSEFAVSRPYAQVELTAQEGRPAVRLDTELVAIDLGGIAKGYAVDRAADALRSRGVTSGIVNVGGDLYAIGSSPDGDPWQVGIRNPVNPDTVLETVPLTDGAIATSGDYLRYFEYGGRRYHHLIDPLSDRPRETPVKSTTIAADNCMTADAAATALFGLPLDAIGDGYRDDVRIVRVI